MTSKRRKLPPFADVVELLEYCPETGRLVWLVDRGPCVRAGDEAGLTIQKPHGYRVVTIHNKQYKAHRVCWLLMTGEDPGALEVVHRNGDASDNSWDNLQAIPSTIRRFDSIVRKDSVSGVPGVSVDKKSGRWRARLRMLGRSYSLGLYDSREDAIQCVEQARSEIAKRAKRGISS